MTPTAVMAGLARTSAASASLLLNLELAATVVLHMPDLHHRHQHSGTAE